MAYIISGDALHAFSAISNSAKIYETLLDSGNVKTVIHVFHQLRLHPNVLDALSPYKQKMLVKHTHKDVIETVKHISENFPRICNLSGSINIKDPRPWLIACARAYEYTLVTNETQDSPRKMPYVCRQPSIEVKYIRGNALLKALGLVV